MPWTDLTIDADRVKALAEQRMLDRSTKVFDTSEITPARTQAALDLVSRKLFDPKTGGVLTQYIATYGSKGALLDAIADDEDLVAERADMLAFAFLRVYLWSKRNTGRDVFREDADVFEKDLDSAIRAFQSSAAYALGATTIVGVRGGGAAYSSYSTYDREAGLRL
jgi:hypothetical protein